MSTRPPSATLVVDANILVAAVPGRAGPDLLLRVLAVRALVVTAEAEREARRVLGDPRAARPVPDRLAERVLTVAAVRPSSYDAPWLAGAERSLTEAAPSANGSTRDAHVLALAWAAGADIWSHDRDFGGTGWPSWSTRNLCRALGLQAVRPARQVPAPGGRSGTGGERLGALDSRRPPIRESGVGEPAAVRIAVSG